MSGRVIFLLEEPSMKALLEGLLPRLRPGWVSGQHFLCLAHEGKRDLDKSIPRKLTAFREPGARFVVLRDNDGADCVAEKARLRALCVGAGRPDTLVRLVCQELESWYLGDLAALAATFEDPALDRQGLRKRFSDPDRIHRILRPSHELRRLAPGFQKLGTARQMGARLDPQQNRSRSFRAFVSGLQRLTGHDDMANPGEAN